MDSRLAMTSKSSCVCMLPLCPAGFITFETISPGCLDTVPAQGISKDWKVPFCSLRECRSGTCHTGRSILSIYCILCHRPMCKRDPQSVDRGMSLSSPWCRSWLAFLYWTRDGPAFLHSGGRARPLLVTSFVCASGGNIWSHSTCLTICCQLLIFRLHPAPREGERSMLRFHLHRLRVPQAVQAKIWRPGAGHMERTQENTGSPSSSYKERSPRTLPDAGFLVNFCLLVVTSEKLLSSSFI